MHLCLENLIAWLLNYLTNRLYSQQWKFMNAPKEAKYGICSLCMTHRGQPLLPLNSTDAWSRHMVVYRVAQEAIVSHREYIDRKTKNAIFTPTYVALRSLTWIQRNLLQRCLWTRQIYMPNLRLIVPANLEIRTSEQNVKMISLLFSSLSFHTFRIFDHNLWLHTPIKLK